MKFLNKSIITSLIFILICITIQGEEVENDYQYRSAFKASFKPTKKLKISLQPEARFDEAFLMDEFIFDTKLRYKPMKHIYLLANYRFISNIRKTKGTEYFNRYALGVSVKNNFNRFTTALRLQFSDYADDEVSDKTFLRYKAFVKYDIQHVKFTPCIAAELFQELNGGKIYKIRYTVGTDYKVVKNNFIGLKYKLDFYKQAYRNRHIFSLVYQMKF